MGRDRGLRVVRREFGDRLGVIRLCGGEGCEKVGADRAEHGRECREIRAEVECGGPADLFGGLCSGGAVVPDAVRDDKDIAQDNPPVISVRQTLSHGTDVHG